MSDKQIIATFSFLLLFPNLTYSKDDFTYVDVTESHVPKAPKLHALGSAFADIDNDGDLDIVLAVEHGKNRIY